MNLAAALFVLLLRDESLGKHAKGEKIIAARSGAWERVSNQRPAGDADYGAALAARLQAGDPAALDELAEVWCPRLYRYLARLAPDTETARDLAQESLIRAVRAILAGTRPDNLPAWLFHIATNLARDDYRSGYRRHVTLCDSLDMPGQDGISEDPERIVLERITAADRREAVRRAMQGLPIELREVLVLRFSEDQPVKVIARILGIPEGTVKSRLYRAYRALEAGLAAWKPEHQEGGQADE